ncbi:branched-chain amino acid ABC transporter substrate-binding protein [Mycolicibacterium agri]|uniref:Amino acid ABC transporter substrate-binding protein n=1 Tax=Mycolicibacterium agri TaxID=36811 RepID=A0A2A7MR98_MYCAG|nr:ABC transporter substrate-binding protein [Mycolicibacterium agri]PEG33841.1 branched-chain amino acid ABC transporter substrate-binding protein [Mycolicibacterium agri]GFG52841.1 amino acid ABC transporter substrate-binding protein [Mycolicibacterium agri]
MSPRALTGLAILASAVLALGGCAVEQDESAQGGDELRLGWLLPQTGPISSLGAPQIAALELAAQDINGAGGANGMQVSFSGGDEAGDPAVAGQAVDRLLAEGVPAIIGAGSSSISLSVVDKITGAQVVQCSGMNTAPELSDYPDDGYYFRTVPPDTLQGAVLARQMADDGAKRVAIIARSDSYATGIADATAAALEANNIELLARVDYDPNAQNLDAEVRTVAAARPDAIVMFSFDEGAKILQGLIQNGAGPATTKLYGTDAMPIASLAESVDPANPAVLQGMTFTQASSGEGTPFTERLLGTNPELETTAFTPYFYDCAVLIALATEKAGSADPTVFAKEIVGLTNGDTECTTYEQCKGLLGEGKSIAYAGAAGALNFSDVGEPTTGLYDILVMQPDGTTKTAKTVREPQQ